MRYVNWSIGLWAGIVCPAFAKEGVPTGPLPTEAVSGGQYLQMILGLLLVLGVIFALAWIIKRMGQFTAPVDGQLKVLGGVSVGQREKVVVVQVGESQLVLGVAPGNVRTLHVFEQPVLTEHNHKAAAVSFAERLQGVLKGKTRS